MTKQPPETELVHTPQDRAARLKEMFRAMVREEVEAQRQSEPDLLTIEVRRQQSLFERKKHSLYYAKWGCKGCKTKELIHMSGGFCRNCISLIAGREIQLRKEFEREHPCQAKRQTAQLTAKVRSAERLLGSGHGR